MLDPQVRRQVIENPHYVNELKSAVTGMFSAWLQDNMIYLSAYATHQGPPGGGTVAVVVDHVTGLETAQ